MMFKVIWAILIASPCWLHAQDDSPLQRTGQVLGAFVYYMPDDLGNVWALTQGGQLKKYNARLDSVGVFNEVKRYGKLHAIASGNPLQALFFFKDYRTILVVDRMLQVVGKIDLRKSGVFQASLVEQSYDNGIWLYDEQQARIIKTDLQGRELFRSADLRIAVSDNFTPISMVELDGYLCLYDPGKGLFVFDYYGALKKRIALLGWTNVCRQGNAIVGLSGGKFNVYQLNQLDASSINVPSILGKGDHVRFSVDGCFNLEEKGIVKYTWKK